MLQAGMLALKNKAMLSNSGMLFILQAFTFVSYLCIKLKVNINRLQVTRYIIMLDSLFHLKGIKTQFIENISKFSCFKLNLVLLQNILSCFIRNCLHFRLSIILTLNMTSL